MASLVEMQQHYAYEPDEEIAKGLSGFERRVYNHLRQEGKWPLAPVKSPEKWLGYDKQMLWKVARKVHGHNAARLLAQEKEQKAIALKEGKRLRRNMKKGEIPLVQDDISQGTFLDAAARARAAGKEAARQIEEGKRLKNTPAKGFSDFEPKDQFGRYNTTRPRGSKELAPVKKSDRAKSNAQYAGAATLGAAGGWVAGRSAYGARKVTQAMKTPQGQARPTLKGAPQMANMSTKRLGQFRNALRGTAAGGVAALAGAGYLAHRGNVNRKKAKAQAGQMVKADSPNQPQRPKQLKPVNYTKISEVPQPQLAQIRRRQGNPGLRRQDNQMLDAFVNQR